MIKVHNIPDSLVINLDQTGLNLVPSGDWTMAQKGSKRIDLAALGDKRQITAAFAATLSGQHLPDQPALLIIDIFFGQKTNAVLTMLEEMRIMVVFVPPNTTVRLQPLI